MENSAASKPRGTGKIGKIGVILTGFFFSSVGLLYIFHGIDSHKMLESIHRIRLMPLLGAVAVYWGCAIVVRAFFIRHLLRSVGRVRMGKAYRYVCIGFLVNNILPLRMGEVARIGGIAKTSGIGIASVTGAAAIERILDFGMAALVGVIAIQFVPMPKEFRFTALGIAAFMFALMAFLVILSRRPIGERQKKDHSRWSVFIWNVVARFASGLGSLSSTRGVLASLGLAAGIWCAVIGAMVLRLVAFELPPTLPMALVLVTSISLGVALPSAPAYVGVYHAFTVAALTMLGVDEEIAVGFAFFSHLTDIIPSSLLGALSMILEGLSLADIKRGGVSIETQNRP